MAAAFAAAVGLHVLIFQAWLPFNALQLQTDEGSTMQVELVKTTTTQRIETMTPTTPLAEKHTKPPVPVKTAQLAAAPPDIQEKAEEQPQQPAPSAQQATQVTYETEAEQNATPGAMPADVQHMILTRISYPRQARRKGWEGRALFHLAVREQRLTRLDLSLSSGYTLLDHAAMRGIRAVGILPLANGLYSLPVEFRLQ